MESDAAAQEARTHLNHLADVLEERSAWVHNRLVDGAAHGVNLQEETLTDDLLLDIAKLLGGQSELTLRQYTRDQEAATGADWQWEWWFHGRRWFGVRVQAKRLRRPGPGRGPRYDLTYCIGGDRDRRQIDVLLAEAEKDRIAPAYVFYNGPELDVDAVDWGCGRLARSAEHFGVSYLMASAVKLLVDEGYSLGSITAASRPWPCLVRCPGYTCGMRLVPEPYPPTSFEEAVCWSLFQGVIGVPAVHAAQRDPVAYLRSRVERYCRDRPPEYVRAVAEGHDVADSQLRGSVRAVTVFNSGR